MQPSSSDTKFTPLLGVLKQMQFWLESAHPPRLMVAAPVMEEFLHQKIPAHCKVTRSEIKGSRELVRGRKIKKYPRALAHWPDDALVEGVNFMLAVVMSGDPVLRVADYQIHCRAGDILFVPARLPRWNYVLLQNKKLRRRRIMIWRCFGAALPIHPVRLCVFAITIMSVTSEPKPAPEKHAG